MKVAIYARVSTKDKGQSTDNQLPDLRAYALAHSYTVYKEYTEEESGSTANREQFKQLFADAHKRRFDLVLFWSLDRFSREGALPTLQHLNLLESYGVGYKSYTEQYLDSTGIFKEAVVSILAIVAKQERVRLSERTKAGLARAKTKGKQLGKPGKSQADIEQIRRLKGGGMSNYAIGKTLGISATTVAKYLDKI
ncbi:MAG: resolvase [Hymenobacter sp.]|nr:MAG: resolvase [Hymenobacter sp.]